MPTAHEVATELRKLADSIDREPETETPVFSIYASCRYMGEKGKKLFLVLAPLLPHPLQKVFKDDEVRLLFKTEALHFQTYVERSLVCTLVEPAKEAVYRCEPLLSEQEEASLEEA